MDDGCPKVGPKRSSDPKTSDGSDRIELFAECAGMRLEYSLAPAQTGTSYTIAVTATPPGASPERAVLSELTSDRSLAEAILVALCDGAVTPCAAPGVADDLLAAAVIDGALDALAASRKNEKKSRIS